MAAGNKENLKTFAQYYKKKKRFVSAVLKNYCAINKIQQYI